MKKYYLSFNFLSMQNFSRSLFTLFFLFLLSFAKAQAPFNTGTITLDGVASESAYVQYGSNNMWMCWDATNLYVCYQEGTVGEPLLMYFNVAPGVPVGSSGTGSTTGATNWGITPNLPFKASFEVYATDAYAEYRTNSGSGWSGATAMTSGTNYYNNSSSKNVELKIPWSWFPGGVLPSSFDFMYYANSTSGSPAYIYNSAPFLTGGSISQPVGNVASPYYNYYFTVPATSNGSAWSPFAQISFDGLSGGYNNLTLPTTPSSLYDFTVEPSSNVNIASGGSFTVNDKLEVGSSATFQPNSSSGNITITFAKASNLNSTANSSPSLQCDGIISPNNGVGNDFIITASTGTTTLMGSANNTNYRLYNINVSNGAILQAPSSGTIDLGLQYGTITTTGTGSINFVNGSGVVNTTIAGIGGNSNTVTISNTGTGTLNLNNLTIASGGTATTLQPASSGTNYVNVAGTFTNNATFNATNGSGTLTVTFNGTGAQSITGSNSTTFGNVIITNGSTVTVNKAITVNTGLQLGSGTSANATLNLNGIGLSLPSLTTSGSGTYTVQDANASGATLTLTNSGTDTYSGVLADGSGGGRLALTMAGSSTLTLSGSNTYTGITTLNSGILSISGQSKLGGDPGSVVATQLTFNGGKLLATGNIDFSTVTNRGITLGASGGTIDVNGNTVTVGTGGAGNIIAGSSGGALTVASTAGGGTLLINSPSTYNGATNINNGTLQLGTTSALPTATAVTIANTTGAILDVNGQTQTIAQLTGGANSDVKLTTGAAALTINGAATSVYGGLIEKAGSLIINGASTVVTLTGSNTYSGGTTLTAGTLNINNGGATSAIGAGTFTINGGTIDNTSGGAITVGSNNAMTWNGNFTYTGTNALNLGSGNVSMTAATQITTSAKTLTATGVISSTGAYTLTKAGAGTLAINNGNTYTGTTVINGGVLSGPGESMFGANPGSFQAAQVTINGGTLQASTSAINFSSNRGITIGASGATFDVNGNGISLGNVVAGTSGGALTEINSSGSAATLSIAANHTYNGATNINNGTMQLAVNGGLPSGTAVTIANTTGAILDLNGHTQTIASISGGANSELDLTTAPAVLTIGGSATTTFAGPVKKAGSLVINGSGTVLTLSGSNTYGGSSTITAGTLTLGVANAIPTGDNVIMSGGTLNTAPSGTPAGFNDGTSGSPLGTLQLTASSAITLGTGNSLYFANSSAVGWTGSQVLTINGWTGTAGSSGTGPHIYVGSSTGALIAGQLSEVTFNGYPSGATLLSTGELVPAAAAATITSVGPTVALPGQTALTGNNGYAGQSITITGANLTGATAAGITFGGTAVSSIVSNNGTTLVVILGAGASGTVSVNATANTATSSGFTFLGYITTAATDWNTGSTWLGGSVPPANATTTINTAATVNGTVTNAPNTVTINSTQSLTFGASGVLTINNTLTNNGTLTMSSGGSLTLGSGATFANGGTYTGGAETFTFAGTGTITGTAPSFKTVVMNGAITGSYGVLASGTITANAASTVSGTVTFAGAGTVNGSNVATFTTAVLGGNITGSFSVVTSGTLTNNTTGSTVSGTVTYAGSGTVNGTKAITFTNLILNGALTVTTSPTIGNGASGYLQLNSGGSVSAAVTYATGSTLYYNVGMTAGNEWTANSTNAVGVPYNVQIGNGVNSAVNLGASTTYRQLNGSFTISSGSSFTLSTASGGDLKFVGGFTNNAGSSGFVSSGRALWFVGTANQVMTNSATLTLDYLILNSTFTLQLSTSNVTLNGNTNALQLLQAGTLLDLNQKTLTLNTGGSIQINNSSSVATITSTGGTGTIALAGTATVTNTSGTLVTSANVAITNAGVFTVAGGLTVNGSLTSSAQVINSTSGSSGLTINGTFQFKSGGYISTNAPYYGSSSTLIYDIGSAYGVGTEWTPGNTANPGIGVPFNVQIGNTVSASGLNLGNVAGTYTMAGTLTFSSNANLSNGLQLGTSNLNIKGNWVNNTTNFANFSSGTGTVTFNGGAAQTIGGTNVNAGGYGFYKLTIGNTSGGVSLGQSASVSNVLNLSSGILTTTGYTLTVTNTTNGGITGGSTTSYISGPVTWNLASGSTNYIFPVGTTGTNYFPFTINTITGTNPDITVTAVSGGPSGGVDATLQTLSSSEYWTTSLSSGTLTAMTVSLGQQSAPAAGSVIAYSTSTTGGGTFTSKGGTISGNNINSSGSVSAVGSFAISTTPPAPTVTSVAAGTTLNGQSANSGYIGQSITITGTNFTNTASVSFNGTAAYSVDYTNYATGTLKAVVAAGTSATAGTVVVTNVSTSGSGSASFTGLGYISAASTDWNTNTTWLDGATMGAAAIPAGSLPVTIVNAVTANGTVSATPSTVTINSGSSLSIGASGVMTAATITNNGTLTFAGAGSLTATTVANNNGSTLSWAGAGTLNIATGGTLTNNTGATLTRGTGTIVFAGAGTLNGTLAAASVTLYNVTLNGTLTLSTVPTIDGTLQINSGNVTAAPYYTSNSTLFYNVSYGRYLEWSATGVGTLGTTAGYPNHVTINTGTFDVYNSASGVARALAGNLTVNNGATMNFNGMNAAFTVGGGVTINGGISGGTINMNTMSAAVSVGSGGLTINSGTVKGALNMNSMSAAITVNGNVNNSGTLVLSSASGGDIKLTGNWQINSGATFTPSTRAVFFTGSSQQTIFNYTGSTLNFDYLINSNTSGGIILSSSPATSININAPGGGNGLSWAGSTTNFDLNGNSLSLTANQSIGISGADNIVSSINPGYVNINTGTSSSVSGSGSLTFSSAVAIELYGGMNFGSGLSTINGILQINANGFVTTNAPTYGTGSTLIYNSGGNYGVAGEWTGGATSGAGVPYNVQVGNGVGSSAMNFQASNSNYTVRNNMSIGTGYAVSLSTGTGGLLIGGSLTTNGTFTANSKLVTFNGGAAQTVGGTTTPTFYDVKISNTSGGVSTSSPIKISDVLTLNTGVLTTTGTNTITLQNTGVGAVTGGSSTSYISGPLNWTLPTLSASASVYNFPVGDAVNGGGAYLPFSATTLTATSGSVLQVQATNLAPAGASAGGSGATQLSSVAASNEYWETSVISGSITLGSVSLTQPTAITPNNAIGTSTTLGGAYTSIAGTPNVAPPPYSINNSNVTGLTSNNYFIIAQAPVPTITSISYNSPSGVSGEVSPDVYYGQTVTLNGTKFTGVTQVNFGATVISSASFISYSNTAIELVVPSPASGNITVTGSAGTSPIFTPTYLGYITNTNNADYNTASTWAGGNLPPASSTVTVNNTGITISGASNAPTTLNILSGAVLNINNASGSITATTVNNSGTFTFSAAGSATVTTFTNTNGATLSWTATGTLNIAASGTLTNNTGATFTRGTGTVNFAGAGTINGTAAITLNNLTINTGALTLSTVPTIDGIFQINNGNVSAAPIYTNNSTLFYNVSYGRFNEWNANGAGTIGTTPGYPNKVRVGGNSTLDVANGTAGTIRAMAGSLTIDAGSTVTINVTPMTQPLIVGGDMNLAGTLTLSTVAGGDVKVGGNWNFTVGGVFNSSSRAVFFNGGLAQTITRSAAGTLNFDYLINSNTSGGLILSSSPATSINVNAPSGGNGLSWSGSTSNFDLNGNSLYLTANQSIGISGADNFISSTGTGYVTVNSGKVGSVSGSGSLTFSSAVTVSLYGGMDFGSGLSTINGTLLINAGGYVTNNAPIYGTGSLLQYYSNTTPYVRGIEWATASGAGYPYNIQISNNTTVDPGGTSRTGITLSVANNLTIDAGSALYMDYSGHNMTVPLNVNHDFLLNGSLSLSGTAGGDMNVLHNWTNNGTFVNNGRANGFNGSSAQTIGGSVSSAFAYLFINNTSGGVTLNQPITVSNLLTLTSGIVTTTSINSLTLASSATTASSSTASYVSGPLNWTLPSGLSGSGSYMFPIGDAVNNGGAYLPLTIATVTTGATGPVVQVQATNSNSSGAAGAGLTGLSSTEYWQISQISGNYTSAAVSLTRQTALGSLNTIGWNSSAANGTYVYESGLASSPSINTSNAVGAGYLVMATEIPGPVISAVTVTTALNSQAANTGYIGQSINITGTNFPSNATVTFNGTAAYSVSWNSATSLTAVVNAGTSATAGTVVVTNPTTTGSGSAAFTNLGYISANSSDWNTTSTWLDGAAVGIPASAYPVTIINNVSVGSAVANTPATVTVATGGTLTIGAGSLTATSVSVTGLLTFTGTGSLTATNITNNNAGTISWTSTGTLNVAASGTLTNNGGTFTAGSGTVNFAGAGTIAGSSAITVNNITANGGITLTTVPTINGTLQLNSGGYVSAAPVYGTSSTLIYNNTGTYAKSNEWLSSAATYPGYVVIQNGTTVTTGGIAQNLHIVHDLSLGNATSAGTLDMASGTPAAHALIVGGNVNIGNGSGTSTLLLSSVSGGDIQLGGNWNLNSGGAFNANGRAVFFTGGSAQTLTGVTTFDYLMMAKTANNLTLNNNININSNITFTNAGIGGKIITGSNVVAMAAAATSSTASGTSYIYGNESFAIATGSSSHTYDIGGATQQAGVTLTYTGVTTAGTVTAYTTDGNHPQIATSGIYAPHSVLRYHTLSNSGVAGGTYNATFYFNNPSDLGSGSVTGSFVVMQYTGSAWNTTTTGTLGSNNSQATGLSTYGDFQIGDPAPQGSLTGGSTCAGVTGQLTWTSTAGTGPFSVTYNDGVSNHTATGVVSGTAFNVSSGPVSNTTYTLVSVTDANGDITSSGFTGISATITVIPTVPVSVSILASPSGAICQGSSVSFVASPTNGGASPIYNFKVNGTSVQSGTNTVLTSNTINNGDVIICYMTSDAVCPSPTTATSNSITESVNPLPTVYAVTGGGNFCPGGSVAVGLSNSQSGINYELKNGASDVVGPISGSGSAITFGNQSAAATYTVVATNSTTGCISNMSGSAVVIVNPQAATPGLSASATTVCSGSPVTFTATGGSQYGFYVNGTLAAGHIISDTSTFTTTTLNDGDQVTVTSYSPFTFDGNITESAWGNPIATSAGGPYDNGGTLFGGGPGFGVGHEINALYAQSDANNFNFAIAGNVQNNNRILLFIQTTSGGYTNGSFGRSGAPGGISNFNSSTTFDFAPNYCLVIGTNSGQTDYFFDLFTLSSGGSNLYLGDVAAGSYYGTVLGASPANGTQTQGFEMAIPKTLLSYVGGAVRVMAMYISDAGYLSNQFLTHANAGAANYGSGAINFTGNPGSFAIPSLNLADNCSATSSPITMSIGTNLTPTISINASATTICTGTTVNFTASITNGGTAPIYQWLKNGNPVGTNSSTFSSNSLSNGDVINCTLTSNASCVTSTRATSNNITMTVNSSLTPAVSIAASPSGAVCAGTSVTFTPTPTFGGTAPTYQWTKNGSNVATGATYTTSSLANGDQIACVMTSNAACASPTTANSNVITMSINSLPIAYNMTGGGAYCSGTSGVTIGLANSQSGVNYQLYSGASAVGSAVAGNGSAISFGNQTTNGYDYNVIATNTTTSCTASMSTIDTVFTNLTPAVPTLFVSENPICAGTNVTVSAANGSLFQFFVNGVSQGAESTTNNFSSSSFTNGQNITVQSYSSIVYDGNISEAIWGSPLATSTGGPSPGFGAGNELNAVYANGDGAHVNLAIAGNVQSGNRILLFIDSKAGGFNVANFSETNAPPGLAKFNTGTTFPTGFSPDYCLVIGVNGSNDNYFDLFTLASTSGAGTDAYLGGRTIHNYGVQAGGNPANSSQTQGFEISLPNSLLGYTGGNIQIMGMYISESTGFLSNQFLTHANVSESNYGSGAVYFPSATPKAITVSGFLLDNTCTATSSPITMSVSAQPTSGTLTSTPAGGSYCAGTSVSTLVAAGSGGAGTVSDIVQYSVDGGTYQPYTSGTIVNTSGHTSVEVETYRTSTVAGCTTSTANTVIWNLNPLPVVYSVTGGACAPTNIGLSGSQSGVNYQIVLNGTNFDSPINGTGSALPFGTEVDSGIYSVVATNATTGCVSNMTGVATVDFCTSTWIGVTDTNWSTQTNWNPAAVPNDCYVNVIIPSGTSFSPHINVNSGNVYVRNISLASGVQVTLSGHNMSVCGNWTGGSGSNAAVVGSGTVFLSSTTTSQTITGNTQFNTLQLNNSRGATLLSGGIISIASGLQLQAGNLDITAGNLHLLSTSSNSYSYIDDFTGTGALVDNTNVQADRYVPVQGFNQHFISSPVSSPAFSQFGASGPDGSYVVPLPDCDEYNSNWGSPYGTMFQYNDGHEAQGQCMLGNWQIRSAGNLVNGQGYSTYLTGNSIISVTGKANTGNISVGNLNNSGYSPVTTLQGQPIESGWALVGNPYPSAISLTQTRSGFQNQVQIWVTSGPYEGSWIQYAIGTDVIVIPPFQAFMVRVNPSSVGLNSYQFFQSERVRTTNQAFYRDPTINSLELDLGYNNIKDVTRVMFRPDATDSFDNVFDANKPDGGQGRPTLYTTMNDNHWYGLNCVPPLTQVATIPVGLHPEVAGTMTITAQGIESFDATSYIYLEDKQTSVWHNLRDGGYTFNTNINDAQDRFVLHFTPPAEILTRSSDCNTTGLITISQPGTASWSYVVTNSDNITVATGTLNQANAVVVDANAGVYTVTLTDNNGYTVVKNIQVGGAAAVVASFTSSATTAQTSQAISFNSSVTNGATYIWNFGDGTTATGQSVTHDYAEPGVYTAELTVTNANGCTSTTTRVITITSRSATGISNLNGNGKISIWSNENRVYVDFSKEAVVDAQVDIYNVLGQIVSSEKFGKSDLYSKEIDNVDAAYMIVRVKNDDQITTKKVFIVNVNK